MTMKQVWENLADLLADGLDHGRGGVAHADHGDARAEVDQGVAVDVDQDGARRLVDVEGEHRAHAGGHGCRPSPARAPREFGPGSSVTTVRACLIDEVLHRIGQ